jgi:hypothetical protein
MKIKITITIKSGGDTPASQRNIFLTCVASLVGN